MPKQKKVFPGFVIDPKERTIVAVTYSPTLEDYYRLTKCDIIQMVNIDSHGNQVVVDEEGLLRSERWFFHIMTFPQPLVNCALVMGPQNAKGRVPTFDLHYLTKMVTWLGRR